jgi:hypothetical protein
MGESVEIRGGVARENTKSGLRKSEERKSKVDGTPSYTYAQINLVEENHCVILC